MATWQLGGLPSMAPQNDNAPRSSVPQPVQYQQQPNVGLMALQGLRGVAEINQQARQQQRKAEFQKAYAGAFESGDRNKMRSLISEYPEEFESVQKGMGFIDDDQRNSIGHLATSAQIASSLGTGAFGKFIADNEDEMRRLGISPESVAEMHVNDPQGFQRLAGSMALFSLGHEKYFDIKDQMEGRRLEQGRLDESMRQADMENARGWANIQNAQLDRAQRAQIHSDEMGLKLMELGQKGKPSADLIKGLNSDITNFGKNYNSVRAAANSLQALSKVNTGAAQLGIIFNYMKSLDPQSVVREGEQVQVMRSDGIWGQIKGYIDQLNAGNGLSQEAKDNIVNAAKINANAMGQQFNQQVDEYLDTYGETIPQGLRKSLERRKAKLFDDVSGQPTSQAGTGQAKAATGGISEGATATNPKTGQKIIYRNGKWQQM
ncbi:MAG: phage DNA ejection protein [Escherichia coli]|uniref:phage DNA ejection protein n=1 Tax=Escherichia coli TaxID=562 RepID=UPI00069C10B0|nr:phage DNA ejection protein [Escherichia coli]EDY5767653.1 acyltransferase [Salmonella enterica subsp. enterica serovar Muenchen]EGE9592322.1 acyltransferase [Salmonella enterica subsp. enterica]EGM6738533.1 acyltransferase [Salmonella enterica subsp. enterica serovar Albany]EIM4779517.1 phage DNA ejection protein [Salmonella enterica]ELZ3006704.1 phage DNA ejection protein [Salmonella enterica subsp. enterica serovar Hadar]HBN4500944.1 phage DNA ejection protein [Escherichia coli O25b:H4-S